MAQTSQGALLTDRHRRRQVRIAVASDSKMRRLLRMLDPSDIDAAREAWLATSSDALADWATISRTEAERYLSRFRAAEIGTSSGPVVWSGFDAPAARQVLDSAGPQAFKRAIREGASESAAFERMRREVLAEAHQIILSAGRDTLKLSADADRRAIGYRRVSDGDPCTFCAMLVSRGPAYTSEARALSKSGTSDPYHPHCGCSIEVVYSEWTPTGQEQQWVDAYEDAAEAADAAGQSRTASTVLTRMRADGTFRDSPARRVAGSK